MESEKRIKLLPDPQNGSRKIDTFIQYIPNVYLYNLLNPHMGKPRCRELNIKTFTESN